MILDKHIKLLEQSGLSKEDAQSFGIKSLSAEEVKERFNFDVAGIYFPYHDLDGNEIGGRVKLEKPVGDVKYAQEKGSSLTAYFNKNDARELKDEDIELKVTEGEKKIAKLRKELEAFNESCEKKRDREEAACMGFPGCRNWKDKDCEGLGEGWEGIPMENRPVTIYPDSDFFTNTQVNKGIIDFVRTVHKMGAEVKIVDLRLGGEKIGVDDFLLKKGYEELKRRTDKPFWEFGKADHEDIPREIGRDCLDQYLRSAIFLEEFELAQLLKALAKAYPSSSLKDIKGLFTKIKKSFYSQMPKEESKFAKIFWMPHVDSTRELYTKIGKCLDSKDHIYIEDGTYNLAYINREQLNRIPDGKDFAAYMSDKIDFIKASKAVGSDMSINHQLIPSEIGSAFLTKMEKYANLDKITLYTKCPVISGDRLIYDRGYDKDSRIYYDGPRLTPSFSMEHLREALDFPFKDESQFSNALGLLLTCVFLREQFVGEHPLGTVLGNKVNLGKSTLAKTCSYVASGASYSRVTYTHDDLELEKRIGASSKNSDFICLDNIRTALPITSSSLEGILTEEFIETRILGQSEMFKRRNNAQFFATLNGGVICDDLLTRSLTIELAHEKKLRDANPLAYVKQNRNAVLSELLGLVLNWQKAGCPKENVHFPKYPRWAAFVNGILKVNGFKGFLSNYRDILGKLSPDISLMLDVGGEELYRTGATETEAAPAKQWRAKAEEINPKFFRDTPRPQGKNTKVGNILKKMKGKTFPYITEDEDEVEITVDTVPGKMGGNSRDYLFRLSSSNLPAGPSEGPRRNLGGKRVQTNTEIETESYKDRGTLLGFLGPLGNSDAKKISEKIFSPSEEGLKGSIIASDELKADVNKGKIAGTLIVDEGPEGPDKNWNTPFKELPIYKLKGKVYASKWWSGEDLGKSFSFDVETELIEGGYIPQIVLASAFNGTELFFIEVHKLKEFAKVHEGSNWIAHNIAFDFMTLSNQIHNRQWGLEQAAKKKGLDTWLLARLINLATQGDAENKKGKYTLVTLCKDKLDISLPKEVEVDGKEVRTSYGDYLGRIKEAPAAYFHYNAFDTIATYFLWNKLEFEAKDIIAKHGLDESKLLSHFVQVGDALAAFNTSHIGFRVDTEKAKENGAVLRKRLEDIDQTLLEKYDYAGGKGQKERFNKAMEKIENEQNIIFPRFMDGVTGKEMISQKKSALKPFKGIEFLDLWQERQHNNKLLKMSVTPLENVTRIHPHISILKNTGRNAMSKPNLQQISWKKDLVDMRAQLIAGEGKILYIADYSSAELVTLAQVCLDRYGFSKLAEAINAGQDVHKLTAARFLGKPAEKVSKGERQYGKIANFGLPGGLGFKRLVDFARDSYGVKIDEQQAKAIKEAWLQSFPEMKLYLEESDKQLGKTLLLIEHPSDFPVGAALHGFFRILEGHEGTATTGRNYSEKEIDWAWENAAAVVAKYDKFRSFKKSVDARKPNIQLIKALKNSLTAVLPRSGRIRANCSYTEFNNTPFQGLLSDVANSAWFNLTRNGFDVPCVVHDEFVVEVDEKEFEREARRVDQLMIGAAKHYCPGVKMGVDGHFSKHWSKG